MASCPFCQGDIAEDLERLGGPCPHCFNEVPGADAATDPGLAAQLSEKAAQRLEGKRRGLRTAIVAMVVVGVGGSVAGWLGYQKHLEQQEISALLAWEDTAAAEFVFITSEELQAMEAEILALEAQAAEDESKAKELDERRQKLALRQAEKALQDQELASFEDRWGNADANIPEGGTAPKQSTMGGPSAGVDGLAGGITIGNDAPGVNVVRKGEVMKGDAQIRGMVDQYVSRQGGAVQACYQTAMNSHPGLGGAWHLSFRLNTDGSLSNVAFSPAGNNGDASFESCVVRRVERWAMNETSQPLDYRKKFTFKATF